MSRRNSGTRSRVIWRPSRRFCRKNALLLLTLLAVIIGLTLGFVLRPLSLSEDTIRLINFPGELFMQMLKMMILPLIFSSLISALAEMDARNASKMGFITLAYYIFTAVLSIALGITLVLLIHPGDPTVKGSSVADVPQEKDVFALDTILDLVRNMFPSNIIKACFQLVQTTYKPAKLTYKKAFLNTSGINETIVDETAQKMVREIRSISGTNVLGILVFCTGFGMVISMIGQQGRILVEFFSNLNSVVMLWVKSLMWFAPLGIVCLIAGNVLEIGDLSVMAQVLMMYVITVILALTIHTVIVMPGIYFIITRKNPQAVVQAMFHALVTGFGTASGFSTLALTNPFYQVITFSSAALPVSIQCLEDQLFIDRRVTRFVLPLGTTLNMDGNALYEAVAVIFIAQLNNVSFSLTEVATVSFTATVASLGLGSVPAGLVSILLILSTVGLSAKDVPLLFTVDWLIDRIRTMINVLGDGFIAAAVAHLLRDELAQPDNEGLSINLSNFLFFCPTITQSY
uniref:Amino acid transporter n=1 Tax=Syphacia muris TaxID=451379 RepID=A0A0N5A849_9BILA